MLRPGPARTRQSFRHEAFFWQDRAEFVDGLLPFIEEGIEAGEAVMVATTPEHGGWLADSLGARPSGVHFVDMTELGRNPARIIPACLRFLDDYSGYGRPARAVGEPFWEGRGPEEVLETQLHEALMNLAIDPDLPFWVVCPYDAGRLDADLLAEAGRSHPMLATTASYQGSRDYRGHDHARSLFTAELPDVDGVRRELDVTRSGPAAAAEAVTLRAAAGDLRSDQVVDLAQTVGQIVDDSLGRGAQQVTVRTWERPDGVVCEVSDTTVIHDLLVGRRHPRPAEHDPVGLANQVCDLVQVRSRDSGTTIRLQMRTQR